MAKQTLQERFIEALKAKGETEVKRLTGCIVFTRKEGGFWYLGKSGSVRYGSTRAISFKAGNTYKKMLLSPPAS